ncbi:hypothetical protein VIBNISFn27_890010 [Vibrio nigripulchritudo SFn27]|uniref:Uncharacterized protein n=1 Tax=Vibrio nigripulchritudo TaxID=28173 RepID=U4KGA0_9VIBR|nr:hypothetical protein VIBNIBLFn1_700036 [Vibrio nigripulchritudo BLFn1]CCN91140.1 hypothetical protein VIBNISFn27_890010 [Vibrio nigripulchritudo SFn27]CCN94896.1 hypothetical protein VIBNIENn2_460009 [Vibrio nigripulchritudo ENn2]CCO40032.1 hypothetical protein VIBNISFn135_210036 [Vibrio nigripulchritudo SFn135]CCO55521.1 hypothetical protein VIBNIWn13_850035 [Vibrio nigripulchritudo Wn13]CCO60173.1 hypothetical protein VIBNI_B0354 [Vibrio nigripulchritudo]
MSVWRSESNEEVMSLKDIFYLIFLSGGHIQVPQI